MNARSFTRAVTGVVRFGGDSIEGHSFGVGDLVSRGHRRDLNLALNDWLGDDGDVVVLGWGVLGLRGLGGFGVL